MQIEMRNKYRFENIFQVWNFNSKRCWKSGQRNHGQTLQASFDTNIFYVWCWIMLPNSLPRLRFHEQDYFWTWRKSKFFLLMKGYFVYRYIFILFKMDWEHFKELVCEFSVRHFWQLDYFYNYLKAPSELGKMRGKMPGTKNKIHNISFKKYLKSFLCNL